MLSVMEMIVSHGAHVSDVLAMIFYLLPDVIEFGLPAASLMSVVVAFLRFSANSEIVAMKSSGISLYGMMPPVIALSLVGFVISLVIGIEAVPWGNRSFRNLLFKIVESKSGLSIKPNIFSEPFDKIVFYVNSFSDKDKSMKDVFVTDMRDPMFVNTIIAERGIILFHPQKRSVTLQFTKGTIFITSRDVLANRTVKFRTYDLTVGLTDIMNTLKSIRRKPKEMYIGELIKQIRVLPKDSVKYNQTVTELCERFSIPLAVFLMGIIGAPLGAQIKARGRSSGIGISIVIFFIYYMSMAGARTICETGALSPFIGPWISDLFLIGCAIYVMRLASTERTINIPWISRSSDNE